MSNQRSVGKFCSIVVSTIVGTSDSIASLVGSVLGEGAEAWAVSENAPYRYTRATITPDNQFFVAASGGGTWVRQAGASDLPFGSCILGTAVFQGLTGTTPVVNVWLGMPQDIGAFIEKIDTAGYWSLNTTTGVRTYSGAARKFICTSTMTVSAAAGAPLLEYDLDVNGARIGGTTGGSLTSQVQSIQSGGLVIVSFVTEFLATNGDNFQQIWRELSGVTSTSFLRFTSVFQGA